MRPSLRRRAGAAAIALFAASAGAPLAAGALGLASAATAATPTSTFYYEGEPWDGIGRSRTGFGTDTSASISPMTNGAYILLPTTPYEERITLAASIPADARLEAGKTYRGSAMRLESGGVRHSICQESDAGLDRFVVHDVAYADNGDVERLSMSVEMDCGGADSLPSIFRAEVRYHTATPAYGGLLVEPNRYDPVAFEGTGVGRLSPKETIRLTAVGSRAVTFGSAHITGDHPDDFRIVDDGCSGGTLALGESCSFSLRFAPTALGDRSAIAVFDTDTPSGHRMVAMQGSGRVPSDTTITVPTGVALTPFVVTTRVDPAPDRDTGGTCRRVRVVEDPSRTVESPWCTGAGAGEYQDTLALPPGDWTLVAEYLGAPSLGPSRSEPVTVHVVGEQDWATLASGPTHVLPTKDGYLDTFWVSGMRTEPVGLTAVVKTKGGTVVKRASIPTATGPYRWDWDGRDAKGNLLPEAIYKVEITRFDTAPNRLVWRREVGLNHDRVTWETLSVTLDGDQYRLYGEFDGGTVRTGASAYPDGVRIASGAGQAAVVYAFPVKWSPSYRGVTFQVQGRSTNGHQAMIAVWNATLGGPKDLNAYDAARTVGPGYKWWVTRTGAEDHVAQRTMRGAVLVWKGLGGAGPATFDIRSVRVTYTLAVFHKIDAVSTPDEEQDAAIVSGETPVPPRLLRDARRHRTS